MSARKLKLQEERNVYTKYEMLLLMLEKYRKYKIISPILNHEDFIRQLNGQEYVRVLSKDSSSNTEIASLMLTKTSKYLQTSNFNILMVKEAKFDAKTKIILVISNSKVSIHIFSAMAKINNMQIYNYLYTHFLAEIPKGPFVPIHEIMPLKEAKKLLAKTKIMPLQLPKIFEDDPQCIWIGARIGQILKLTSPSELAGMVIEYKLVIPSSMRSDPEEMPSKGEGSELPL
jgi:DNA-directed RNA polymerase subunit H (RpoH/RPB5)